MGKCTKQSYKTETAAKTAAYKVHHGQLDLRGYSTYQCATCRYPDRRRAWHWGHQGQDQRRKKRR